METGVSVFRSVSMGDREERNSNQGYQHSRYESVSLYDEVLKPSISSFLRHCHLFEEVSPTTIVPATVFVGKGTRRHHHGTRKYKPCLPHTDTLLDFLPGGF